METSIFNVAYIAVPGHYILAGDLLPGIGLLVLGKVFDLLVDYLKKKYKK